MIETKKELSFYLMADRMMNRGVFKYSLFTKMRMLLIKDYVMEYLAIYRKYSYYKSLCAKKKLSLNTIHIYVFMLYFRRKYGDMGLKCGFSIAPNVLGYGVVIPHFGTIVVGPTNKIGNYACLHTCTCITANGKQIGNNFAICTGAKVTSPVIIGDNVTLSANSLLNKSFPEGNVLLVGSPAISKIARTAWWSGSDIYKKRVLQVEELKREINI